MTCATLAVRISVSYPDAPSRVCFLFLYALLAWLGLLLASAGGLPIADARTNLLADHPEPVAVSVHGNANAKRPSRTPWRLPRTIASDDERQTKSKIGEAPSLRFSAAPTLAGVLGAQALTVSSGRWVPLLFRTHNPREPPSQPA
jgi:hypothetical protein